MIEILFSYALILYTLSIGFPLLPVSRIAKFTRTLSLLLSIVASLIILIISLFVLIYPTYNNSQLFSYQIISQPVIITFTYVITTLSAIFSALIAIVSISILLYSIRYVEHYQGEMKRNFLIGFINLFLLATIMVIYSLNMISFLFYWEIFALSAFFLVMYEYEEKETRKAGLFFFVMTQLSTFFLFLAFLTLYINNQSLKRPDPFVIQQITGVDDTTQSVIFLFILLAFGIKAGIVPFHKWLVYAHPASPSNVSAMLSGLMIKIPVYGLVLFLINVLTPNSDTELIWGITILIIGSITGILGVIYALKEQILKRMLAYSSIENIGIIFTGIGLAVIFYSQNLPDLALLSLASALFHAVNHGIFKALLFLGSGAIINVTHTKNIEELGGLIKFMPYTAIFFLIGSLAISALPPLNGFVSELMIFLAFFQTSKVSNIALKGVLIIALAIFSLTSALASACFVKAFGSIFLGVERSEKSRVKEHVPNLMRIGQGILALLCILLGLFSYYIFTFLGYSFSVFLPNMLLIGLVMFGTYIGIFIIIYTQSTHKQRISDTWGCGYTILGPKTEYSASGFSEPLVTIFRDIYRTKKHSELRYFDNKKSIVKDGTVEIKLIRFFEEYLYKPIIILVERFSKIIAQLENDNFNTYILYLFIALFIILFFLG